MARVKMVYFLYFSLLSSIFKLFIVHPLIQSYTLNNDCKTTCSITSYRLRLSINIRSITLTRRNLLLLLQLNFMAWKSCWSSWICNSSPSLQICRLVVLDISICTCGCCWSLSLSDNKSSNIKKI